MTVCECKAIMILYFCMYIGSASLSARFQMAEPHKSTEEALKKVAANLECGICLDQYKDPKLLSCFHVFCKQCLEHLVLQEEGRSILRCPSCRRATTLPLQGVSGLQSDFHAHHLFEIQDMLVKAKEPQCEKCKLKSAATGFCHDCGKLVCDKCTEVHQTWEEYTNHRIVTIQDVQADAVNLIPPKKKVLYCPKHKENVLKIYCETCSELICIDCTIRLHQGHHYDVISDTFPKHEQEILNQLEPVKHHLATVNQAFHTFDARSKEMQDQRAAVQEEIHRKIDQLHQVLEQRRTELIGQLDQLTQHKLKSLAAQRDQVELLHTQLTSCLEYMEGSLKTGTQGEILELKAPLLEQINQITANFNPDTLVPEEEANIFLVTDSDLHHACEKFAEVATESACPDQCFPFGFKSATVGETMTVTVHAIDQHGKETHTPVKALTAELVRSRDAMRAECQVRSVGGNKYELQYQPVTRGEHQLHIRICGKNIMGSPYTMVAMPSPESLRKPVRSIGNLQWPWGVATSSRGHIIVAEHNGHCVSVFTPEGQKIRSFGSNGTSQGQIRHPRGVAVDRDDNIIVVEWGNRRIQKFTSEGKFLKAVGTSRGSGPLQFDRPLGASINNTNDKVYIADAYNHRIQILNTDFTFSSSFGTEGSGDGQFNYPTDTAVDSIDNLYIADQSNHRIQVFTPEGKFLHTFGCQGSGDGQLHNPWSITIDRNDTVYVADSGNNRISVFSTQGQFLGSFGSKGKAEGQLHNPGGVAIDHDSFILVSDCINSRIQIF